MHLVQLYMYSKNRVKVHDNTVAGNGRFCKLETAVTDVRKPKNS